MKNIIILLALFATVIVSGTFILDNVNKDLGTTPNTQLSTSDTTDTDSDNTNNQTTDDSFALEEANSSHTRMTSFADLKSQSDLIVEVTGTDKYEEKKSDYIAFNLCTVNVKEAIKGTVSTSNLQVLLDIDIDPLPEANNTYLMFLKKETSGSNTYYIPVGYGQGIYKLTNGSSTSNSSASNSNTNGTTNSSTNSSSTSSSNNSSNSNSQSSASSNSSTSQTSSKNMTLESNSPLNSSIFTELKGSYSTVKTKLK